MYNSIYLQIFHSYTVNIIKKIVFKVEISCKLKTNSNCFLHLIASTLNEKELKSAVITAVRKGIGPVAAFRLVIFVPKLPKTRSGKIPRHTLAKLAAGKPYKVISLSM